MKDKSTIQAMNYPWFSLLALPYARLELPGWGKLLNRAGVYEDELWKSAPTRTIHGKWHGYLMNLDLSNWSERQTYFLGRFYDLPTQLLIQAAVKPGYTVIDVGANIGMITLLAAHHVGSKGIVYAFEPNPIACDRLQDSLIANELQQVIVHPCGLSNQKAELTLSLITEHTGTGTLAKIPEQDQPLISKHYEVSVFRGDDILPKDIAGVSLIKIDVEGFEPYVLQGLPRIIQCFKPIILTEVVEKHLERAGSSVKDLCAIMQNYGYEAFNIETKRANWRHHLLLSRSLCHDKMTNNVLWLHPDNNISSRLTPWIS